MKIHVINFAMNKFCPFILIAFLMFYESSFSFWRACVCFCLTLFISHFHFKTGYAVAYCEQNNITLDNLDDE